MKTLRILASLAILACVPFLASCRTTVPGPAYVVRVIVQGTVTIQPSAVSTLEVVWDPNNPALHFPPEGDMMLPEGVTSRISTTNPEGGNFIVDFPNSYVVAHAEPSPHGFEIKLPFFSRDSDAGIGHITPLVTVRALDGSSAQFATGASYAVWPIVGGNTVQIALVCDPMRDAVCNPP